MQEYEGGICLAMDTSVFSRDKAYKYSVSVDITSEHSTYK